MKTQYWTWGIFSSEFKRDQEEPHEDELVTIGAIYGYKGHWEDVIAEANHNQHQSKEFSNLELQTKDVHNIGWWSNELPDEVK